jgi:hypothetical protein
MDYLTPCPIYNNDGYDIANPGNGVSSYSMAQLQHGQDTAGNFDALPTIHLEIHTGSLYQPGDGDCPTSGTLECSDTNPPACIDEADEYPLDEFLEDDMLLLAQRAEVEVFENHMPPASVVRHLDRDSRSVSDYDPSLQHSPQSDSPDQESTLEPTLPWYRNSAISDDLLDEEVDWDAVLTIVKDLPKDPSLMGSREIACSPGIRAPAGITLGELNQSTPVNEDNKPANCFVRPPFPHRAGSPIPELDSQSILGTCFNLAHLISQATHYNQNQQQAIFELYARVTYSSRESMTKKQHFQFVDLLSDTQPCIAGVLTGWRVGSVLDQQSHRFITGIKPKLCWCICKVHRDFMASVGWKMVVKEIREVAWDDIQHAKLTICGDGIDEGEDDHQMPTELPVL